MKMISALTTAFTGSELLPEPKPIQVSCQMHELIEEFLNLSSVQQMCPAWCSLAEIALVIAVGTSSPERTFSAVTLIKTPLRNRMSPPMLDALLRIKLLTTCGLKETELSISLLKDCAWNWIIAKKRRSHFTEPPQDWTSAADFFAKMHQQEEE